MYERSVTVGIGPISREDVMAVARHDAQVVITDEAWAEVRKSREIIEALADDQEPHYGVSTGFGALATRHIPIELRAQLQRSLVRSHAAGSGPEVEREVVRALMLLRISTLATGRTGIRDETLRSYVAMLNAGLTPVVYEYGSLGCSGDLAPLSHCALALMGEGIVRDSAGTLTPTREAFAVAGIAPVTLAEKEGLALINGTDGMLGMLLLAITDLWQLLKIAEENESLDAVMAYRQANQKRGLDADLQAELMLLLEQKAERHTKRKRSERKAKKSETPEDSGK